MPETEKVRKYKYGDGKDKGGVRRGSKSWGRELMFYVSSFIKWFNFLNNVDMTFKIKNVNLNFKKKILI